MVRSRLMLCDTRNDYERSDSYSFTACGITVGYIAQTIALGYSGNAVIPPRDDEAPHDYAYRMVSTQSKPRVAGGPPIIHNNAPPELFQDCEGPGGNVKRDGSCPLTQTNLLIGTATTSPTTTTTTTLSCYHEADPQNTCTAIANGPGWCVCGDSLDSYAVQTSTDLPCGWTTLPPETSFDCPTATTTLAPAKSPTTVNPAPSTPAPPPPNAGIAIWLQQYRGIYGADTGTWFAYSYTPEDVKLGDPCNSKARGLTLVPNGTPTAEELSIYPTNMAMSAYDRKLDYTSFFSSMVGSLWDTATGEALALCTAVAVPEGVGGDAQRLLTPRLTCEWVN